MFLSVSESDHESLEREVRHPRIVRGQVRNSEGQTQDLVARNISACGLGATCKGAAPLRGERIAVILPGGIEITGTVCWYEARRFGMLFDRQFDVEMIARALQRQAHVQQVNSEWQVESRHRVENPPVSKVPLRRV